ncbi:MAG: BREX-3 system phosphatase PglZ [Methanomicrobiales archaeon]|nr:BREX-3 system phosphatase PglZ [Methanomicrobiales archaeon]
MTEWQDRILTCFRQADTPVIVALDPDEILLEEQILQALRADQFDLLTYTDPVTFRHTYEPCYRAPLDRGEEVPRLIARFAHNRQESVPYDILQKSECIQITLADLFPGLDYRMVQTLDSCYYDALYEATQNLRGKRLGQKRTARFILEEVFSIQPAEIRKPGDLIALLCKIHHSRQVIPDVLIDYCLEVWSGRHDAGLPEIRNLFEYGVFMLFLQDEWARYLSGGAGASRVPFDDDQIKLYIDTFFLEGALKPLRVPLYIQVPSWAQCGIIRDHDADQVYRLKCLLERIEKNLPGPGAKLSDWKQCARLWAEAVVLYSGSSQSALDQIKSQYCALHQKIETAFGEWILGTFPALQDRPYLPTPVMVHQIPHYLAHRGGDRIALVVIDGMALDQWLTIKEMLGDSFTYTEDLVCAWVPTLTSISRRSLFAGEKPSLVSGAGRSTQSEENLWRTFWHNQGKPDWHIWYSRGNKLKSLAETDELIHDATPMIAGFIINTVDELIHSTLLGMPQMHDSIRRWMKTGNLQRFITCLLDRGYQIYITADHGNVCACGIGIPRQGDLIAEKSLRARIYHQASFAEEAHRTFPEDSFVWPSQYLGTGHAVLLASGLKAFSSPGTEILSHGSIALEEVLVPFIQIRSIQ